MLNIWVCLIVVTSVLLRGKGYVMTEAETGLMCFEGGRKSCKPRNTGSHSKLKKTMKHSPFKVSTKTRPIHTLIFAL